MDAYVLFEVNQTIYGLHSSYVQQMEMVENLTRVPNAPDYVDGVVYVRGQVVPVINVRRRFGFERIPYDLTSRLVVLNLQGRVIGLAVDSAREFVNLDSSSLQSPPEGLGASGRYLRGIAHHRDRLVFIVDPLPIAAADDIIEGDSNARSQA